MSHPRAFEVMMSHARRTRTKAVAFWRKVFVLFCLWALSSTTVEAAFNLSSSPNFYTIDTDAGLVFSVRRTDNGSTTQSIGDISSLVYNGVEYQNQTRGSHINSGFDFLGYPTANVSVSAAPVGTDFIKVTVTTDSLTHYYMARRNFPHIYMATHFTQQPVTGGGLCRYIMRLSSSLLPNGPIPSDIRETDSTVESGDIFGFSPTHPDAALRGQTRSKHYSNMRLRDWSYIGATGNDVGFWMLRDNHEGGSGGPFYRSLLNQGGGDQEITYIINYGEGQTENFRTGILNSYTLVATTGDNPGPVDTSWFGNMGLTGYISPSGRGTITGAGITNRDTSRTYTVGFSNPTAQFFTTASPADGSFTMAGMIPGTYTMSVYKNELAVHTSSVSVSAGVTTALGPVPVAADPSRFLPLWRIGIWDGSPTEFMNGDKVTTAHPSDVRMSGWSPGPYLVGTSKAETGMPCYQWKDVNANQVVRFNLSPTQLVGSTIRVGITTAHSGGRPNISVNSWTSPLQGASPQPDTRTLTVGTYRGNNTTYSFSVPASALVAGVNTLTIYPISGSGGTGFLSPGYSLDCIDMYQGNQTLPVPGAPSALNAVSSDSAVRLTWPPLEGATSYIVSRGTASGGPYTTVITDISSPSFVDLTAQAGTTYSYIVRGANSSGTGLPSPQAVVSTSGAASGLLAQLRFDETSGLIAADATGNGWSGTLANAPLWDPGLFNGSVALTGSSNAYLTLPEGVVGGLNDFTIAGWVKIRSQPAFTSLFDFGTSAAPGATTGSYMCLMPTSGTNAVRYAITTAGYLNEQSINGPVLSTGSWTHLAVTLSGTTGGLYVNGTLAGTNNAMTLRPSSLGATTRNYLGRSRFAADPYLDGSLDDFRIYGRALNAAEVLRLSSIAPVAPSSLVALAGDQSVTLRWPVSDTASTYNVKRAIRSGGEYTTIATGLDEPIFTDALASNETTWFYVVTASNASGESANSPEASAQPGSTRIRLKFDESTGVSVSDSSGSGNHAVTVNGPPWEAGKLDNAIRLNGAMSQHVLLPGGIVSDLRDITVMCWIKPVRLSAWQRIFDFGTDTSNYMFLAISGGTGNGRPRFGIRAASTGEQSFESSVALTVGAWNHVAFVQEGNAGRIYINGALVGNTSGLTINASSLGLTTRNYIGKSQFNDPSLDATVDHFQIHTRAFSSNEIASAANTIPSPPGPLVVSSIRNAVTLNWPPVVNADSYTVKRSTTGNGPYTPVGTGLAGTSFTESGLSENVIYHYVVTAINSVGESANSAPAQARPDPLRAHLKFDESGGSLASDSSGDGNHATTSNAPAWETGKTGNAIRLSGSSSQYASMPKGIVSGLNDHTVSAWVKMNSLTTWARIFDFGTDTAPGQFTGAYMSLVASDGGGVRFIITNSGWGNEQIIAGPALTTGVWTHVAVTQSGSVGKLFINGVVVATNTNMTLNPGNLGITSRNYLGRSLYGTDPYLNGSLDDFRIHSRALSESEIAGLASPDTFATWIAGYPEVGASDGFLDDPDDDGIANGVENYLGTNPAVSNPGMVQVERSGSSLSFQHPRNETPAVDLSAEYLWSTDLATWTPGGTPNGGLNVTFVVNPDTPEPGTTTVTAILSGEAPPRFFSRLRVVPVP